MEKRNFRTYTLRRFGQTMAVALAFFALSNALAFAEESNVNIMPINVKNAPVLDVLKSIADVGGFDLAISSEVKGTITVFSNNATPRELLDVIVNIIGAAYADEDGVFRIMKAATYQEKYGEIFSGKRKTEFFVLQFADAPGVVSVLSSVLDKAATVSPVPGQNLIHVSASPSQIELAREFIAKMDLPEKTKSFPVANIPVQHLENQLRQMIPRKTPFFSDIINQRIIISAPSPILDQVEKLISSLDQGEGLEMSTITAQFTSADSLAAKLTPHLTESIGQIFYDVGARQIVVVDFPSVISKLDNLAALFDVPPQQVLIDACIVQVSVKNSVKSGIDWEVVQDQINLSGRFPALANAGPGFRGDFGDLTSNNFQVLVQALQEYGETELLSNPRLVVANHGTSSIHVGSQVPYKTIDTRETSSGTINQFEKVIIVDVGVKLEVTAHILCGGLISLAVRPEVSAVTDFIDNIPVVEASMVESSLTVKDGNTVILGGLIKEEERSVQTGVPLLSSIPLIKYLFSSTSKETIRSELVILLTPKILTGREAYEHKSIFDKAD